LPLQMGYKNQRAIFNVMLDFYTLITNEHRRQALIAIFHIFFIF
jgi:hypothetical protein